MECAPGEPLSSHLAVNNGNALVTDITTAKKADFAVFDAGDIRHFRLC
jgi:hypothetical protein